MILQEIAHTQKFRCLLGQSVLHQVPRHAHHQEVHLRGLVHAHHALVLVLVWLLVVMQPVGVMQLHSGNRVASEHMADSWAMKDDAVHTAGRCG